MRPSRSNGHASSARPSAEAGRVTRSRYALFAGALLATVALLFAARLVSKEPCFQLVGDITCRVETRQKAVALTFDDGPTELGVDAVLPVLAEYDAQATFFLVGSAAERKPELVERLLQAGHEVGNHSYSHVHNVGRSAEFYRYEIETTNTLLRETGAEPKLFRPPYGTKLLGLPRAVEAAGLHTVTWDVEEDYAEKDPALYAAHILDEVRPGSIILIHPMFAANETARAALPRILSGLREKGYAVVTVSELIAIAAAKQASES